MPPFYKAALFAIFACIVATETNAAGRSRPKRIATDTAFKKDVLPIVKTYCGDCHGADDPEGGISFHDLTSPEQILQGRETWDKAIKLIRVQGMPPLDYDDRPSHAEREAIIEWLDLKLYHVDCDLVDDAGRVTIHRLNRIEYNNTVRDLFGVDINPADDFPSDALGYGFSNNGDALSLPPLLFEKYIDASERIAAAAIQAEPLDKQKLRFQGKQLKKTGSANLTGQGFFSMSSTGSVYHEQEIKVGGEYIIRVEAAADQAGPELAKCDVRIDGKSIKVHEVRGQREMGIYEVRHRLKKGKRRIEATFINDYYNPKAEDPKDRDRNMAVRFIELQGPLNAAAPEVHRRIVFTKPSAKNSVEQAATEIFKRLLPRTFRRQVDAGEVERIVKLVKFATDRGETFERGVQIGLQAILVSPHFLFRAEFDSQPNDGSTQHSINDFELASRLSYFLWSTMPDNELFRLARSKQLHEPKVLDAQIARMLKDPRADALVDNFASQWLNLSNLVEVNPDQKLFPEFTPELRADMVRETQMFARTIFRENRSLIEFLDADFTFANERLAKHYGIDGVQGNELRQVSLPAGQRSGVLTHGAILTLTSNPDRTSLVRRGVWIVNNVLGLDLPDPPGNVPSLEDGAKESGAKTMREQLKIHRESPACASCHETLDPLGFGFENFDAIGRWRVEAEGVPVDSGGTLPSGESFRGPAELVTILLKRKRGFVELVTKKMLTYALGRGLDIADSCTVDDIVAELEENDYRFNVLVREIVHSKPFLKRRGEEGTAK
jgi:Protein of unknown function (DUF1592)/Protein of unknown function (DUF1588)/Protein of unknown function (DUF1587)/Protein of unknown function (DUF1585)/Protein of unknown function (DUF1595)/Ca-dependent carbohydrate-binding module xylan-binding